MLNLIAVFLVCSGVGIAVHIAIDLSRHPQSIKIMNTVWILTALWGSYLALWAYNKFGRSTPMESGDMKMDMSGVKGTDTSEMQGMSLDMSMGGDESLSLAVRSIVCTPLWSWLYTSRYYWRGVHKLCPCNNCKQSGIWELGT